MKAKRTALLGVLACLVGAFASAQVAPDIGGDIGLFTIPTADQPLPGHFTLGAYGWLEQLIAGQSARFDSARPEPRLPASSAGEGLGRLRHHTRTGRSSRASAATNSRAAAVGRAARSTAFRFRRRSDVNAAEDPNVGTKVTFFSETDTDLRVGVWLDFAHPRQQQRRRHDARWRLLRIRSTRAAPTGSGAASSRRASSPGWFPTSLAGHQDFDVRPPNLLRFGVGVDLPLKPLTNLHVIGEIDYTIEDGGDLPEPNYVDVQRRRPLLTSDAQASRSPTGVRRQHRRSSSRTATTRRPSAESWA